MDSEYCFPNIIGNSKAIKGIFVLMNQAIEKDVDILITGETGTGKDLVAREIHNHSPRKDKNLLTINCGSFTREMLTNELFGLRKGVYVNADRYRRGIFEAGEGGTVILDDIDQMPLDTQLIMLNVLNERKVQRVGEFILRDINVRVISISNRDMLKEAEAGRFRNDLYEKLDSFHIHLPSLRERAEDIPLLAEYFYKQLCCQISRDVIGFSSDVMEMLQSQHWVGNVRELRNEIIQACLIANHGERIQRHHFSSHIRKGF